MCKVTKNIFKGKDVLFVSKKTFVFSFLLKFAFDCCMYLRGFCLWSWLELLLRPFHAFVQNIRKLIIFSRFLKCHFVWKWKFFLFFKIKNETFRGDFKTYDDNLLCTFENSEFYCGNYFASSFWPSSQLQIIQLIAVRKVAV